MGQQAVVGDVDGRCAGEADVLVAGGLSRAADGPEDRGGRGAGVGRREVDVEGVAGDIAAGGVAGSGSRGRAAVDGNQRGDTGLDLAAGAKGGRSEGGSGEGDAVGEVGRYAEGL